jgi:hypothetical protein
MPRSARQIREIAAFLGDKYSTFVAETDRKNSDASRTYGNAYADENGYNHQLYVDANRAAEIVEILRRVKKERATERRRRKRATRSRPQSARR